MLVMAQAKSPEEREFDLKLATREHWTKKELGQQLRLARFEAGRTQSSNCRASGATITVESCGDLQRQLQPRVPQPIPKPTCTKGY